jgi:uncharacterized membrane protein YfcA
MLPAETILFLVTGAVFAGLVMGLVGFGTGLAAYGFWLFVIDPILAVPLVSICSLTTTAFTLRAFAYAISWRRLTPFFIGAVLGLPVGVFFLEQADPTLFKVVVGLLLVGYTLFRLTVLPKIAFPRAGRLADAAIGVGGGVLGGFAAVPAPLITVWSGLRGWRKDEQRAVYQPINQSIVLLAFAGYASRGMVTAELGLVALYCVPAVLAGMALGMIGYSRLGEAQFQKAVLLLLLASGCMLILLNAMSMTAA